jgi:hypothetical protein
MGLPVLAFLASVAVWPGIPDMATVPRWAVIAVGLPLVSRLDPREVAEPFRWLLLGGLAWAALSVAWSPDRLGAVLALFYLLVLSLVFVAAAAAEFDAIMTGLAAGAGVSAVIAMVQMCGWSPVAQFAAPAGLFFNRDLLGEFLAPVAVWVLLRGYRGFGLALLLVIVATHSRSAGLAALLGLIYAWRVTPTTKLFALSGVVVLSMLAISFGDQASAQQRIAIWWQAATHLSVFGHGIGWFQATYPLYVRAHSDLLQLLAELGLGAILWILTPVKMFAERRGELVQRAVLLTVCVEAAVSFPLHTPMGGFVAAAVAGSLAAACRRVFDRSALVAA